MRRGCKGSVKCHFCGDVETVNHLFISCSVARFIWRILQCTYNFVKKPDSVKDLFGDWLRSFGKEEKKLVVVGAAAVIWTIWNARSEIFFEKKRIHDPFVLIHRVACFTNSWAILKTARK